MGGRRPSPKSRKRTCSCSGRLTPRDRRRDACICRSRAWATSDALKVVAEKEGTRSMGEPYAHPPTSWEGPGRGLTRVKVHVHDGSDGAAGPQVP